MNSRATKIEHTYIHTYIKKNQDLCSINIPSLVSYRLADAKVERIKILLSKP